ncbi:MAG: ATP synthase subunit C [Defluviitaleaceae bacterium]|nr:ATP synthase subunit C [Defluviitaleaceae bacterium]
MEIFIFTLLVLSIACPFAAYYFGEKKRVRFKKMLAVNLVSFFGVLLFATVFLFSGNAQAAVSVTDASGLASSYSMAYIAAASVMAIAAIATGIAVGQVGSAAMGALSENDKVFGKALIFVAMAEGISIFGLVVSMMILSKIAIPAIS